MPQKVTNQRKRVNWRAAFLNYRTWLFANGSMTAPANDHDKGFDAGHNRAWRTFEDYFKRFITGDMDFPIILDEDEKRFPPEVVLILEKRPYGLVLISDSEEASKMLDEAFGSTVGEDGVIAMLIGEVRLSDGCVEHYLRLEKIEPEPAPAPEGEWVQRAEGLPPSPGKYACLNLDQIEIEAYWDGKNFDTPETVIAWQRKS